MSWTDNTETVSRFYIYLEKTVSRYTYPILWPISVRKSGTKYTETASRYYIYIDATLYPTPVTANSENKYRPTLVLFIQHLKVEETVAGRGVLKRICRLIYQLR